MNEFEAYFAGLDREAAGEVASGLQNPLLPDADRMARARDAAKALNVPTLEVTRDPERYESIYRQTRAANSLTEAPKTQHYLRNPENLALAQDEIEDLGWFETFANAMLRSAGGAAQAYNSINAATSRQRFNDARKDLGQITREQAGGFTMTDPLGNEVEVPNSPTALDAGAALYRWMDSRAAHYLGLGNDETVAQEYLESAAEWQQYVSSVPMTQRAEKVKQAISSFDADLPILEQLGNFGAIVGEDPAGFFSFLAQVGLESTPQIGVGALTMLATRNPAAAATAMGIASGSLEGGNEFLETLSRDGKVDLTKPDAALAALRDQELFAQAQNAGAVRGLIIGAFDGLSGGIAGKVLARSNVGNLLLQGLTQMGMGGAGEALAQFAVDGKLNIAEVAIEALAELVTAPFEVAAMGGRVLGDRVRKVANSGRTEAELQALTDQANKMKLKQRAPDKFLEMLKAQGFDDALIHIPADKAQEFFQMQGFDPFAMSDEVLDIWGVPRDEWDAALATGGDITVPASNYAANLSGDSAAAQFVMRNGTMNPDAELSAEDAERFASQDWASIMEEEFGRIYDLAQADTARTEARDMIRGEVYDGLRNRHTSEQSEKYADLIAARMEIAALETGRDLGDLWREFNVSINSGGAVSGVVRRRGEFDAAMGEIRAKGRARDTVDRELMTARRSVLRQNKRLSQKRPLSMAIAKRGGIAPDSPAARELAAMGVNRKTAPFLFKRGGHTDLDNLVASEWVVGATLPVDEATGYLSPQGLLDAIALEQAGSPVFADQSDQDAYDELSAIEEALGRSVDDGPESYLGGLPINSSARAVATQLDALGLDIDAMTDDEIAAALGVADMRGTDFASGEAGLEYDQDGSLNTESEAFKKWFGDSKVVDADGAPLVVYHGTNAEFDAFDLSKAGATDPGLVGSGVYLTPDRRLAEGYGGNVVEAYASIQNPMIIEDGMMPDGTSLLDAHNGKLTKAGAKKLNAAVKMAGHDGVIFRTFGEISQVVAFNPAQIKSVNNRGTWDGNDPRILYQSAIENDQPLYVTHNLSAEKLRHAADLGGIAAPSLAVARGDIGFDDFGEISLIGDPSMADPKSKGVRLFNADVYSPRQPRARHKVDAKGFRAMASKLEAVAEKYGLRYRIDGSDIERGGLSEVVASDVGKAAWLDAKGEGVPVQYEVSSPPAPVDGFSKFSETIKDALLADPDFLQTVERKKTLALKIFNNGKARTEDQIARFNERWGADGEAVPAATIEDFALAVSAQNEAIASFKPGKTNRIDTYETGKAIDAAIAGREVEFNDWVHKEFGGVVGASFFENEAGRKKEYTLQNIVREMTRTIRNGEKWNYGAGNVRAAVAPEFKSLKAVKDARGQITDSKAMDALKDEVNGELLSLADEFAPYVGAEGRWGWSDDFAEFLKDMAAGPRAVAEWPWVSNVPAELMGKAGEFLEKLKSLPTYYFEIKMQRAMDLSEFSAAVIPSDLADDARQILTDAGLDLIEYEAGGSRKDAVASVGERVFFQDAPDRTSTKRGASDALGSIRLPAGGFGNGQTLISLFDGANLSTFLHEAGHLFLEIDLWIAQQDGVSQDFLARHNALRDWLGMEEGKAPTREQHEKFARGFEAYLMDGESPSVDLASAFGSFRRWLRTLYSALSSLRVKLTPEVRNVMDRMIATQDAIDEARMANGEDPLFAEAPAGMGERDWATYQKLAAREKEAAETALLKKTMARIKRERTAEMKEARARIEKEVRDDFGKRRNFQLIHLLGNKAWLSGAFTNVPDLRLDAAESADMAGGEGILSALSREKLGTKRGIFQKGGDSPRMIADMFGYATPQEMFEELQNTPKLRDAIAAEVEARIVSEYGDPLSDGSIQEAADLALRNDAAADRSIKELRQLGTMRGNGGSETLRTMKARAERLLSKMSVREASKPESFLRIERKAANDAQRAFADVVSGGAKAGNAIEAAYKAKERQILAQLMYRQARDFRDQADRAQKRFRSYDTARVRGAIGSPHIEQIDNLLATYSFKKKSERWVANREGMVAYIERMRAEGREHEVNIDPAIAAEAGLKHYSRMSVEEFLGLRDTVYSIESLGRLKDKLRTAQGERELARVLGEVRGEMDDNLSPSAQGRGAASVGEKNRKTGRETLNWVLNADSHLREIGGGKDGKSWWHIKAPVDRAISRYTARRVEVSRDMESVFSVYTSAEKRQMAKRFFVPELGAEFSKWDLVVMALNSGNEANWDRLTNAKIDGGALGADKVDAALGKHLGPKDWAFAQDLIDYINTFWPEISAQQKRVKGVPPKKVEAQSMSSAAPASFTGGYYPIAYDSRFSARVDDMTQDDAINALRGGRTAAAATKNGHTKERAKSTGMPVDLSIERAFAHVDQVIKDLEMGEDVAATWQILQKLKGDFMERGRKADYDALEYWIKDTAAGETAVHGWARIMRYGRSGFTISRLALNITTILLQPTGILQSFVVVGKKPMLKGLLRYASGNTFALANGIREKSPMMRERQVTMERDLMTLRGEVDSSAASGNVASRIKDDYIVPASMALMAKVQYYTVDAPTWIAAYDDAMARGESEDRAITYADHMVKRAQGSGLISDRGMMERGRTGAGIPSELPKLFTALGSYMFAKFNVAYERTMGTKWTDPIQVMSWAADMVLLFTLEAVIAQAIRGNLPDDEEEDWPEWMLKETALSAMGTLPFVRDAASIFQGFGGGGASQSVLDLGVVRPATAAWDFFNSEDEDGARKLLLSMSDMAGVWLHLPSAQVNRMLKEIFEEDLSISDEISASSAIFGEPRGQTVAGLLFGE